jgi:hypothetical protein
MCFLMHANFYVFSLLAVLLIKHLACSLSLAARDGLISQNNSFFAHHQIEDFIVQLLNHQLIDFPL